MRGMPEGLFWGKFDDRKRTDGPDVEASWHPLADHSADVAAVAEALLTGTLLGGRLARLGGLTTLSEVQVARLGFLAGLHDFGKLNSGFQRQIFPGQPRVGHVVPAIELLDAHGSGYEASKIFQKMLLDIGFDDWFGNGLTALQLLVATICHHGRPYQYTANQNHGLWQPAGELDPLRGLKRLIDSARGWFPAAFAGDGEPLPAQAAFQHGWNGLLNLADWLGSDSDLFPFSEEGDDDRMAFARRRATEAIEQVGLEVGDFRAALGGRLPTVAELLGDKRVTPRPLQEAILEVPVAEEGSIVVAEATTGEGKTEAALLHFLRLFADGRVEGLYFALPTRAAASQLYRRIDEAVKRIFPEACKPAVLQALPGYAMVDQVEGKLLPRFRVLWPDDWDVERRRRAWAAERSKRFLAGTIVVGTVDQALLSALSVKHSHLRAAPLLRHLLVVDEVHASDAYMTRILESVLDHQLDAGGHSLLLSATLGGATRQRLLRPEGVEVPSLAECLDAPYPALVSRGGSAPRKVGATLSRRVEVSTAPVIDNPEAIATLALDAAGQGAHVLVLRNTVSGAIKTQEALEKLATDRSADERLFRVNGVVTPHHSRYAASDRGLLDAAVEEAFRPKRAESSPVVLVATQTVEQSLDLDTDLLITDLCPVDVLLQRIGRLHRHTETARPDGYQTARGTVLVPADRDLTELLQQSGEARGKHGLGSVYPDLRTLETTWRQLEDLWEIAIPDDCRRLVEECLHPEALAAVGEIGEKWRKHQRQVWGAELSEKQMAALSEMNWETPFGDLGFNETNEKIRTRLGEEDVRVEIPGKPPIGPFGEPVKELTLGRYLFPDKVISDELSEAEISSLNPLPDGGFGFLFAGQELLYDRLGVRKVEG